jgi:hypothetical protein
MVGLFLAGVVLGSLVDKICRSHVRAAGTALASIVIIIMLLLTMRHEDGYRFSLGFLDPGRSLAFMGIPSLVSLILGFYVWNGLILFVLSLRQTE